MFSLREFIMKGIKGMVGKEPDYKVIEAAAGWLDKGVLTESDLEKVDMMLTPMEIIVETADTEQTDPAAEEEAPQTENPETTEEEVTENE